MHRSRSLINRRNAADAVRIGVQAVRGAPKNSLSRAQTGYERAKLPPQCWSILGTVDIR
jgi:hypothetical protein